MLVLYVMNDYNSNVVAVVFATKTESSLGGKNYTRTYFHILKTIFVKNNTLCNR